MNLIYQIVKFLLSFQLCVGLLACDNMPNWRSEHTAQLNSRTERESEKVRSLRSHNLTVVVGARTTHWHTDTVTQTAMLVTWTADNSAQLYEWERESHQALLTLCSYCWSSDGRCCCCCCYADTGTKRAGASAATHLCCLAAARLLLAADAAVACYLPLPQPLLVPLLGVRVCSEFAVKLSTCAHQGSDKCLGGREQRRVRNFHALCFQIFWGCA